MLYTGLVQMEGLGREPSKMAEIYSNSMLAHGVTHYSKGSLNICSKLSLDSYLISLYLADGSSVGQSCICPLGTSE